MTTQINDLDRSYLNACEQGNEAEAERLAELINKPNADLEQRMRAPEALAQAALWYGRSGIPVFPLHNPVGDACSCGSTECASPGKHPRTRNGFENATTRLDIIGTWWRRWPQANIGTPTGLTFDVIDVDGPDGIASILGLSPEATTCGLEVPALPPIIGRVTTQRDGGHHLYTARSGRGNRTKVYPGVDYRGVGGYVVVPPSRGMNGRLYAWMRPLDQAAIA